MDKAKLLKKLAKFDYYWAAGRLSNQKHKELCLKAMSDYREKENEKQSD